MSGRSTELRRLLVVAGFLLVAPVLALESDRTQQMEVSADGDSTMRIENDSRIVEMSNNVNITQGTLQITGNRAIFVYDARSNELNRVTVYGTPVQYRQQIDEDGSIVRGSSNTIQFYTEALSGESIIELQGNASIESPDTTWSCVAITYIVERNLIPNSTGPCVGTLAGAN